MNHIYILRLRPCRRPPLMQRAAGTFTAGMGIDIYTILLPKHTISAILSYPSSPNITPRGPDSQFIRFGRFWDFLELT
jgi:hypothetical protein